MIIKDEEQKQNLLEAGRRLREVLDKTRELIKVGVETKDIDKVAYDMIVEKKDKPAFLNYRPAGAPEAFPATTCISINKEMVHGVPSDRKLELGDIVSVDCGLEHKGCFVDAAYTVIVGGGDEKSKALVEATRRALESALLFIFEGSTTGDIGAAVESVARDRGFTIPPELGGHGVGASQHEDPFIPNMGDKGQGDKLRDGEVIAVEPIFSEGDDPRIKVGEDGFAYCSFDDSNSAHFEHTILVTKGTPIIVTGPMW